MSIDEAKNMLIAKANCIDKQCKGIHEDCNESLCDNCVLCYAQGTNGEQIKLLRQCADWLEELKALRHEANELRKAGYKHGHYDGYNKAIDDFYNALAGDLIWIKERFGDDVYTDLWCDVGTRAEQLKAGGDNE